ncbi:MAG: LysR family transcriptional regulator [Thomasclavelia sp.]|nr:LysR family transcriptional regulator [Thomasclavelia sp.]
MTYQQLKYLITISECGSLNAASKALFISQPTLSNAIKELENELKIKIFTRNNKGVTLTDKGNELVGYARQALETMENITNTFTNTKKEKQRFTLSAQHYSFVVDTFIELVKEYGYEKYDFSINEVQTSQIIDDVKNMHSNLGILYLSKENNKALNKIFTDNNLEFHPLFVAKPHVFISKYHPLAKSKLINIEDLKEYPFLSFNQGSNSSLYFSEEILSTYDHKKSIKVSDRATLFNLLIGLNGYTISTGIIAKELDPEVLAIPLDIKDDITVGYLTLKNTYLSEISKKYIETLKRYKF